MGSKLYIVLLWRNISLIAFKFKVKSKWCSENKLWIELGSDLKVSAVISVGKPRLYRTHLTPNRLKSLVIFFGQCVWVRWEATEMWMDILLLCCAYWIYSTYTHIQITNQSELLHKALHWILITDIITIPKTIGTGNKICEYFHWSLYIFYTQASEKANLTNHSL